MLSSIPRGVPLPPIGQSTSTPALIVPSSISVSVSHLNIIMRRLKTDPKLFNLALTRIRASVEGGTSVSASIVCMEMWRSDPLVPSISPHFPGVNHPSGRIGAMHDIIASAELDSMPLQALCEVGKLRLEWSRDGLQRLTSASAIFATAVVGISEPGGSFAPCNLTTGSLN